MMDNPIHARLEDLRRLQRQVRSLGVEYDEHVAWVDQKLADVECLSRYGEHAKVDMILALVEESLDALVRGAVQARPIATVAETTGYSRTHLYDLTRHGQIPYREHDEGRAVSIDDVRRYERRKAPPTQGSAAESPPRRSRVTVVQENPPEGPQTEQEQALARIRGAA